LPAEAGQLTAWGILNHRKSVMFARKLLKAALLVAVCTAPVVSAARAEPATEIQLSYKDKKFEPAEIRAPANTAIVIKLKNLSGAAMEFESKPLKVEKVIAAGADAVINVRPQKAGKYLFVDEYNEDVAKGTLVVQ
jgi:plastocyanin